MRWLMLRRGVCTAGVPLGLPVALAAQVSVGPNVQVSAQFKDLPHEEVDLRAHPTDPNRLIACGILTGWERQPDGGLTNSGIAVYTTADGGQTWTRSLHLGGDKSIIDPTCALGRGATAYYVSEVGPKLELYRSPDGGRRWLPPVPLPEPPASALSDRSFVVVDPREHPAGGTMYISAVGVERASKPEEQTSTIKLWHSTDGGASFGPPVQHRVTPPRRIGAPPAPALMADGTVLLGAIELQDTRNEGWRCRSLARLNARYLLFLSRDGGRSLSEPRPIATICHEDDRPIAPPIPTLAVDASASPFRDRSYAAWLDRRTGHYEVMVSWSADTGRTWSRPMVVDANRAAPYSEHDNFMPQLAVSRSGVVGLVWADRRDYADNLSYAIRFTASLDGGETWLPSVAVSSAPASYQGQWTSLDPNYDRRGVGREYYIIASDFLFTGGHTFGFAADAAGVFHPLWVDNRTGVPQMWTAVVRVDGVASRYGDPALAAYRDLRGQVALELLQPTYDAALGVLTVTSNLANLSQQPIRGPFLIQVTHLSSPLGVATAMDADTSQPGRGAIWRWELERLAPGARSPKRVLMFRLANVKPMRAGPGSPLRVEAGAGLLSFRARVLAPPEAASR